MDFPGRAPAGAVPGTQPKLLVREQDHRFVAESSEQEILARYLMCEDLAHQLVAYSAAKRAESSKWSEAQLRDKVAQGVRQKSFGWGLSPAETEWVLRRLETLTGVGETKVEK